MQILSILQGHIKELMKRRQILLRTRVEGVTLSTCVPKILSKLYCPFSVTEKRRERGIRWTYRCAGYAILGVRKQNEIAQNYFAWKRNRTEILFHMSNQYKIRTVPTCPGNNLKWVISNCVSHFQNERHTNSPNREQWLSDQFTPYAWLRLREGLP